MPQPACYCTLRMCGRYTLTSPAQVIAEVFGVAEPIDLAPRYNVCPGQDVPVVRTRHVPVSYTHLTLPTILLV